MLKILLIIAALWFPALGLAQDDSQRQSEQEPVIKPPLERRNIKLPRIDTEDFEIGGFGGVYSAEDFGSDLLVGAQFSYHISEDFFLELAYGQSKITDQTFADSLIFLLQDRTEAISYYNMSLGYNVLPGEVFLGSNRAFASAMYVAAGAGTTTFNNEDHLNTAVGAGIRLLFTDWLAFHVDLRDNMFETDITGANKLTHNFMLYGTFSIFF